MSRTFDKLAEAYDRNDQATKRDLGKYIHDRPWRWISRQELVEEFAIDESVVGRHLDSFHEDGFVISTHDESGQRLVRWNGRGAGGLKYWLRTILPERVWRAGSELRPLITLDALGGAYPILVFTGFCWLLGLCAALFLIVVIYGPHESIIGVTAAEALAVTGLLTVVATVFLILVPVAYIVDRALLRTWYWVTTRTPDDQSDEN